MATRAALGQHGQVLAQIHMGGHFENDIHTPSAGQIHDLFQIIRRAMIHHMMRALLRDQAPPWPPCRRCR